ncbi:PrpF domain-containing protein [Oceanobacillus saliphilus]|uniref:PrpF domain-containing protein n=1 Tax=Oceanobacillus saliphilus TaxID=2925834 RepID=UPI00201E1C13|nr:PrpF domain-containing protein [Oceanobacillus saliphilus]
MSQTAIPCSVYRGGTSRGLFFNAVDLPENTKARNHIFTHAIDAYNPSQINGLGSGTSHSSKVVVIGKSQRENIGVEYTFYQIGIGAPIVDDQGTCGNLMAAVGAFAVDEGFVEVAPEATSVTVHVFNTNINREVKIDVPLHQGKAKVSGDYLMPGIVTPGSKYSVNIMHPGAGKTGKTAPLDKISKIKVGKKTYDMTFLDIVNPFVYVAAADFGLRGTEPTSEITAKQNLMDRLNCIRDEAAVAVGFADSAEEAKATVPAIPKIAMVAAPQDYTTTSGKEIKAKEIDILAKMISMEKLHRTFAGSGLYNLAAAALLPGTIPNQLSNTRYTQENQIVRIGHPDGIAEVQVSLTEDQEDVFSVGLERTARRIMKGEVFIPEKKEEETEYVPHLHIKEVT